MPEPEMCAWCGRRLPPDGYMSLKGADKGKKVHFFNAPPDCRPPAKPAPKKPQGSRRWRGSW